MREEGRGKLWLALAAAAVMAVVMVGGVILNTHDSSDRCAAASPVDMQPQSSEIDERAATVGRDVPNALQSQDDEQKLVDAFDEMTDAWLKVKPQGVTVTDAIAFTEAFRKVSRSRRNACIHRALNLIPDGNAMLLTGILLDKRMDKEIVRTVFNDVLNREESVKKPILRRIFKDKDHPCWDDVAWILEATGELPKSE